MRYLLILFLLAAGATQAADPTKPANNLPKKPDTPCPSVTCQEQPNNLYRERQQERERYEQIRRDQEFNDRNREIGRQQRLQE